MKMLFINHSNNRLFRQKVKQLVSIDETPVNSYELKVTCNIE